MPTPRYEHRLSILPYAPAFRGLRPAEQDALMTRLYAAHDLCELSPHDRAFMREAALQIADGAAEQELPGSTGDYGLIDDAVDSGDDDLIERVLDTVGRGAYPLTADEASALAEESEQYAEAMAMRPSYDSSDFAPGKGAIWHHEARWTCGAPSDDQQLGTGPFTALLVLRLHPDGTLDVCRLNDVPLSPKHERAATGTLPYPAAFIGLHTPVQVWLGLHPARRNVHPYDGVDYPAPELERLLTRLHLR